MFQPDRAQNARCLLTRERGLCYIRMRSAQVATATRAFFSGQRTFDKYLKFTTLLSLTC